MNRNTASTHSRRHSVTTSGIKLIIIFKSSILGENSLQIKMGISMIITVNCIFIKGIQCIKWFKASTKRDSDITVTVRRAWALCCIKERCKKLKLGRGRGTGKGRGRERILMTTKMYWH